MATKVSEFKGHKVLEFHESVDCTDKYPITMGVRKLKTVLQNLEVALKFVQENDKSEIKV